MPADALGEYYGKDFTDSPRTAIRNRQAWTSPVNLVAAPRRKFGQARHYSPSGLTIGDAAATAPDGSQSATIVAAAAPASWLLPINPISIALPAGSCKPGIWVRWRGTGDPNFRFGVAISAAGLAAGKATTT